jgi:glycosyltransferase involved in cell wall biosynthesis
MEAVAPLRIIGTNYAAIVTESGIPYPCPSPYTDIGAFIIAWNEEARLGQLIERLQPWFERIAVVVQESDDRTWQVAEEMLRLSDRLISDKHHGWAEPSAQLAVAALKTDWVFRIDCDEWPSDDLLGSLGHAKWLAEERADSCEGVWLTIHETIEGLRRERSTAELRLAAGYLSWPSELHSRPATERVHLWPYGYLMHSRSLTEVMEDYLRYLDIGRESPTLLEANVRMMREACEVVARDKGWTFVQSHAWWPAVEAAIYEETKPWLSPSP